MHYFFCGVIIGFCIAAPVGPIGILCINRTLKNGFLSGLFTGLGATMADGVYGTIASLSLTCVSSFLFDHRTLIDFLGSLLLIYLGASTLFIELPNREQKETKKANLIKYFSSTFLLTMTNPMTILFFAAAFTSLDIFTLNRTPLQAGLLMTGIISGSFCWWFILSTCIRHISKRALSPSVMIWINRISGVVLMIFGGRTLMVLFL